MYKHKSLSTTVKYKIKVLIATGYCARTPCLSTLIHFAPNYTGFVPRPLQFSKGIQESYLIGTTKPCLQGEMNDSLLVLQKRRKLDNNEVNKAVPLHAELALRVREGRTSFS
jgi:hypothetical protein